MISWVRGGDPTDLSRAASAHIGMSQFRFWKASLMAQRSGPHMEDITNLLKKKRSNNQPVRSEIFREIRPETDLIEQV